MTRYKEALEELENSMPEYIESVGTFQHENKTYELVNHYTSEHYLKCEICGHERIIDVYVIKDTSGKTWKVGNVCINKISNQNIKEWFKNYKKKKDNIEANEHLINFCEEFLEQYDDGNFIRGIRANNIERMQTILGRMCEGKNPTPTQHSLVRYYMKHREEYF